MRVYLNLHEQFQNITCRIAPLDLDIFFRLSHMKNIRASVKCNRFVCETRRLRVQTARTARETLFGSCAVQLTINCSGLCLNCLISKCIVLRLHIWQRNKGYIYQKNGTIPSEFTPNAYYFIMINLDKFT